MVVFGGGVVCGAAALAVEGAMLSAGGDRNRVEVLPEQLCGVAAAVPDRCWPQCLLSRVSLRTLFASPIHGRVGVVCKQDKLPEKSVS